MGEGAACAEVAARIVVDGDDDEHPSVQIALDAVDHRRAPRERQVEHVGAPPWLQAHTLTRAQRARRRGVATFPTTFLDHPKHAMPAVQVEPCFLTNLKEAEMLADAEFRGRVARAIADGVERFFGAISASAERAG